MATQRAVGPASVADRDQRFRGAPGGFRGASPAACAGRPGSAGRGEQRGSERGRVGLGALGEGLQGETVVPGRNTTNLRAKQ